MNVPLIESALKTAGNDNYKVHTYQQANHWFAPAEIGITAEMRKLMQSSEIDDYEFVTGFLELLGEWITTRVFIH